MSEDEEQRGFPELDEAQKAAAIAALVSWEEEWLQERKTMPKMRDVIQSRA